MTTSRNDLRVGLQWEDFLGKCSSKLTSFWAALGFQRGLKQMNPPLFHLFFFWGGGGEMM